MRLALCPFLYTSNSSTSQAWPSFWWILFLRWKQLYFIKKAIAVTWIYWFWPLICTIVLLTTSLHSFIISHRVLFSHLFYRFLLDKWPKISLFHYLLVNAFSEWKYSNEIEKNFSRKGNNEWINRMFTWRGENENVTIAFAAKFMSTAIPDAQPRVLNGKISERSIHPIGPNET